MTDPAPAKLDASEDASTSLRMLVAEIAELAESQLDADEFHREFLRRVVMGLAAYGGAIWLPTDQGWRLQCDLDFRSSLALDNQQAQQAHDRLVSQIAQRVEAALAPPGWQSGEAGNPSRHLLALAPLVVDDEAMGVVEIVQRSGTSRAAQEGYLRFLTHVCGVAAQYHQRRRWELLREQHQSWDRYHRFARLAHASLSISAAAYHIANTGRWFLECDRLTVAVQRGRSCRVAAISGQDVVNSRSDTVRLLNRLATRVVDAGEPVWYAGPSQDLPPQLEQVLQQYVDHSHAKCVAVIPLRRPQDPDSEASPGGQVAPPIVGALLLDLYFDGRPSEELRQRLRLVREHAALALGNALDSGGGLLLPLARWWSRARYTLASRRVFQVLLAVALAAAAAAALVLVPADFDLEAQGSLQPEIRRNIFVIMDGVIENVPVRHGQLVRQGDVLAVLQSPEHELKRTGVLGEIQTAERQIAARRASLLTVDRQAPTGRARYAQLAADLEELTTRRDYLQKQYDLLLQQSAQLTLLSPVSGQVLTWDVKELLADRPVHRGQILMQVADWDGPWVLELYLPEHRSGHVRAARQRLQPDLEVAFVLATDPSFERTGRVQEMATTADVYEPFGNSVMIKAAVDRSQLPSLRPGASVTARLHCGRRPLGYVWFHGLYEWFHSRILFRL